MGETQRTAIHGARGRLRLDTTCGLGVLAFGLVGLATAVACGGDGSASSRSSVSLYIERIGASSGGTTGEPDRTFIQSDVVTGGTVFPDTARVTLRIAPRDPGAAGSPAAPTVAHFATVDRYRVRYLRSHCRNAPGIDVPHAWDGALALTTSFGGETGEFVLVRASAKLEPPLITLRQGGGDVVINVLAHVTFYGRDHGGARLEAAGAIDVQFADWSDAEPTRR